MDSIGWASLKHGGLLIAPSRLGNLPPVSAPIYPWLAERLRTDILRLLDADTADERKQRTAALYDSVLVRLLGLSEASWIKGPQLGPEWSKKTASGVAMRPTRVWQGAAGAELPLFQVDAGKTRLGVGNNRRDLALVLEWMRRSDKPLALVTTGRQWRLVHAGTDHDAWCEWDIDLWFQEGQPGPQVAALRALLSEGALVPRKTGERGLLLQAIVESRKGQNELSAALGERVRQAVERLVAAAAEHLDKFDGDGPEHIARQDLYRAAVRMVMRCVVVLFAEARDLLPRIDPNYHAGYGLQDLREQLARHGDRAGERLRHSHQAWPRLVALMRLVHNGSAHPLLTVTRYGGELFRPGDLQADDSVLRAIAVFEDSQYGPNDHDVRDMLELLCISRTKVRQGTRFVMAPVPVDFSDLSSEYIGILYEGLLDFELRRADDLTLFLGVGDQPALPFSRLDAMSEAQLKDLFSKLKKADKKATKDEEGGEDGAGEEDDNDDGEDAADDAEVAEDVTEPAEEAVAEVVDDVARDHMLVKEWAKKAAIAAGMVKPLKLKLNAAFAENYQIEQEHAAKLETARKQLIARTIHPGEWYLARWGGTRKGSGTFYTRPQLAGPTVRRTLQPLAYEAISTQIDPETSLENVTEWRPRRPEVILALKVCDPAMGSGSFLVSALRFLTQALWESLYFYNCLQRDGDRAVARLADGLPLDHPSQQPLPLPPEHPDFDARLRALLRRHIVERCLYGVDLDPLAVELGKLALWIETMDPRLPFGFLDHKLRCGNALVGCWFDRFRSYPLAAWDREGGDKTHTTGVHFAKDTWTKAIAARKRAIQRAPSLRQVPMFGTRATPEAVHDRATAALQGLHALPVHETEERSRLFKALQLDPDVRALQAAMDLWCALWFWPADKLDLAPTPTEFQAPSAEASVVAREVAGQVRFLHWELAFPDVFDKAGAGFDAVVGNPPWEIQKPNSKEFFSNIDPMYRTYGKTEATEYQKRYFTAEPKVERNWLDYVGKLKSLSNWVGSVGASAAVGAGYADPRHPFVHQGSADVNTYKLFLELAHALLRDNGQMGFIVPSGIYSDKGTTDLRRLFLDHCRWHWLFSFENRNKIFDIHRSFKFCPLIVQKGGRSEFVRTAFMRHDVDDWLEAERHVLAYPRERVEEFSPKSRSLLELRHPRDLQVLSIMYAQGVLLGDDGPNGWGITYAREFDMTNDAKLFPPRTQWEAKGYRADEYGHWLLGPWHAYAGPKRILERPAGMVLSQDGEFAVELAKVEDVALPLYQGVMLQHHDHAWKAWLADSKGKYDWVLDEAIWIRRSPVPKHLISTIACQKRGAAEVFSLGFRDITNATNERTFLGAVIPALPCGNVVGLLKTSSDRASSLSACLNSFSADWSARCRIGGTHLNWHVVQEFASPRPHGSIAAMSAASMSLGATGLLFSSLWREFPNRTRSWRKGWAVTPNERTRLRCILDAAVAKLYGLGSADFAWILRDCDHPTALVCNKAFARTLDPKGFYRVDKAVAPELRHTVLSLVALHELERIGLDAFLALNDGEGWMLPETLRLADYGLGHDDRAQVAQPVASVLGDRFYDWQLNEDIESSWEECRRHAEAIEAIMRVGRGGDAVAAPVQKKSEENGLESQQVDHLGQSVQVDLFGQRLDVDLFGQVVKKRR